MSALAARRAAAVASASASPASTPPPASPSARKRRQNGIPSSGVPAQLFDETPGQAKRKRASSVTAVQLPRMSNGGTAKTSAPLRPSTRFSPGAPVSDEDEMDSSGDEVANLSASSDESETDARLSRDHSGGAAKVVDTAGKSTDLPFTPRRGVNLITVTSEELQSAGLNDGPGVLVSLAKDEVRAGCPFR